MATTVGGVFDTTVIGAVVGSQISNLIASLKLDDKAGGSFTQTTTAGGITTFESKDATLTNNIVVASGGGLTTTTNVGSTSTDVTISGGTGSAGLAIIGSNESVDGAGIQTQTQDLVLKRLPDTKTGEQVSGAILGAITDLSSTITGANGGLAVTDLLGGTKDTVVDLTNKSGDGTVLVLNTGTSGATVNLDGYKSVVTTGSGKFNLSDEGSSIQMVTGSTSVSGGTGSDSIIASYGNHTVAGGAGADTFGMRLGSGEDTVAGAVRPKVSMVISDFNVADGDKLHFEIPGIENYKQFTDYLASAKEVDGNVVAVTRGGDTITLTGVKLADLNENMFTFG